MNSPMSLMTRENKTHTNKRMTFFLNFSDEDYVFAGLKKISPC